MKQLLIFFLFIFSFISGSSQKLYEYMPESIPGWASFENPTTARGEGGKENYGAKGHAHQFINPGQRIVLLNYEGAGVIQRIWMTINKRSPSILRAVKIEMYWDGANKPAVAAPLGDFFGAAIGKKTAFENALFADPEDRSFNCIIPMPFKKAAKIVFTNESQDTLKLYYYINFTKNKSLPDDVLYFHTYWNREQPTQLGVDFEILPKVRGKGRFLGTSIAILTDSIYNGSWWGEGEIKMYFDGDEKYPSLAGTGTEDYIGTAWGQGTFTHQFTGSLIADPKTNQWAFYRFHIPDPIYFSKDMRVTLQQIGGCMYDQYLKMKNRNAPMIPVTVEDLETHAGINLYKNNTIQLDSLKISKAWVNFFRQDDVCATAYFYLDQPENNLPALAGKETRIAGMKKIK